MSDASAPPIYTSVTRSTPLGFTGRLIASLVAMGCLAILVVAILLPPNPSGSGTHTGLGLQHCQLLERTGLPCPSCGMTTSFSWFVRGNLLASLYVQPMGCLLAALTMAALWMSLYIAVTGQPAHRLVGLVPSRYYLFFLMALGVAAWGWKMFIVLNGIDGWK